MGPHPHLLRCEPFLICIEIRLRTLILKQKTLSAQVFLAPSRFFHFLYFGHCTQNRAKKKTRHSTKYRYAKTIKEYEALLEEFGADPDTPNFTARRGPESYPSLVACAYILKRCRTVELRYEGLKVSPTEIAEKVPLLTTEDPKTTMETM